MIIAITVVTVIYLWLFWEAYNSPTMPDEYNTTLEERKAMQEFKEQNDEH